MSARRGCGQVAFGCLLILVVLLVFAALAAALVMSGEVPVYAPRLIGFQPDPNYAFRPTTPITLTFDQPMNPASVEDSFSLVPSVPGTFQWSEDRSRATFVPDPPGYEPDKTYRVRLAPGIRAGTLPRTTERGLEWRFSLAPLLDTQTPPLGRQDLGAWTQIEASFNYPLDCSFTLRTFSITPEAVGVLGCRDRMLAFKPSQPMAPGTTYVATVKQVYLKDDPSPRAGVRWEFQTAPPLSVVDVSPAQGEPLLDLWTPVRITLNRPVVADSVLSRFSLVRKDGPLLSGQVTWERDGAVFLFQPDEPLRPGARYEITLQSGVQDALGFRLAEPVISEFGTASMTGLPLPVPGSKNVALDSIIRVPFTRPMDKASVEEGLVLSPTLAGEMAWDKDTLVFTPRGGLAPETPYQIGLTADVRDASGAPLGQPSLWAFVTEPFLLDTELPSDAVVMELQQPIEFTFALPMDRGSVQSALMISPTTPGDLSWSDDARAVSYQPDPGWLSGVDYQVTLSGSARTADGYQTLGEDLVWTFSTGVAEVQFGQGPNVQVVHADAERAIQVIARGADVADFHLYPITPTQFLDAYSSGFRGIGPWEPQILDTVGLTPTVQWREALMPLEAWDYGDDWRAAEVHLPEGVLPGLYILSAEPASEVQGQLLVALTRHALILKRALAGSGSDTQAQIVAWDSEMDGGAPVISSTVRLYDREGTFLAEGVTNADGLLVLDVPGDPAPLMALSDRDGDVTVCGLSNEWSEGGWWWIEPPRRPLYSTYSYTDRPIYRPGQTVYFKDLVRADEDVSYTLPAPDLPVTVRLRDARDNIAASQVLTPTQFGTVYGEFHLADEPMLGTWHLETEVDSTVTRQPLKVEEYRKPEYEVTVQTPQKVYVVGEAVSVTVQAAYYFDQPVAGANAVLTVYPTYPEAFYDGEEGPQFGYPLLVENGRTDEQGVWTVMVPTEGVFSYRDRSRRAALALEMTITDDTGQSVSSYQTVVVQRTSQALTLLLERRGYEPDEEIAFSAQVHDRDGEPVVGAELTAQILGWDDQEVARATASTGASGLADFGIRLAEQGWYQIRVRGIDDGGREVEAEEWLWVYDPSGQAPWYPGQQAEETSLSVSADQATYAVGDEARLAVYTRVPGPALLAFERGGTRHVELIELVSGTNLITVPIRANYAPNIHVSVNQFGPPAGEQWPEQSRPEAKLHRASTQLLVPMTDRRLTVSLTADQAVHGAGDEATFRVQVTDHQGEPVVAEVSLAVVDEAIYALAEDMSKDPFEVFYAPRPNMVRTFDSLRPSRWLYPEGPGLGGGEEEAAGAPRRTFLDTAYWVPTVVTDENGEATVALTLPDNLTEWRALARAVTTDTLVGQATVRVVVSQDIVVRPALPRFLVQGDAITLTAVVHNFTQQPVSATVELDVEGLTKTGDAEQIVHVPAGGSAMAGWPVAAEGPGEALVTVRTTATRGAKLIGRDAVELPLPVYPLTVPEAATFAGTLTPSRPTDTITVTLPTDAIGGLSRLEINLAPSIAPGLLDGLEYLIDYPFG